MWGTCRLTAVTIVDNPKTQRCHPSKAVVKTHLKHGRFYADILTDWRDPRPCFIYVVQRHGSAEILAMGACNSEEEAIEYATDAIEHFRGKSATAG